MSVLKGIKKLAKSQTKRRKKMEAEKPLSARRDMAKKDVFTGQKYLTGGPKTMKRMTPEYRSFLNKQAKKETKKDKRKAMALAGATGATLAGATVIGAKKEKERLEKKYDNKVDIKNAREAAKKKGNKTFTVDGLRYDTSTGRRKPLSAAPLLEATQRRINFEKARDKKEKNKKPVKKKTGGLVTRWESKWG